MKSLLEVREYNFEHCTITVRLDRRQKTLSFVEWSDIRQCYEDKKWLFAERSLKYMNGWKHILQAMQYVIDDCKKVMESWEQEETDNLIQLMAAMSEESEETE